MVQYENVVDHVYSDDFVKLDIQNDIHLNKKGLNFKGWGGYL